MLPAPDPLLRPLGPLPPAAAELAPAFRLSGRGLAGMAAFYAVFGAFYAATIAYAVRDFQPGALPGYLGRVLLLDYPLKALWTLPVWWLLFRGPLRQVRRPWRLLSHAMLAPAWVSAWVLSYYAALHALGLGSIGGNGRVWDLYIPVLFYGVQFGVLHALEFTDQLRWQSGRERTLREQVHASTVAALKAQINPHFLFNTLNSISASVPPELEATRELVARLAHTFRYVLQASRHEELPLGEEISFLRAYLDLEHARFGERLRVSLDVAPELLGVRVPPMLLQPLVENAVRHGLSPAVAGGRVAVDVRPAGPAALRVSVTDTGLGLRGRAPAELLATAPGVGLRNTHARLLAAGSRGLEISEHAPHGVRVSFVLPVAAGLPAPTDATLAAFPA
ncbi:sensor histidine kinase [Hymenobacter puniceus]|uniref:sensor histidine kinase n=1 Tax=Hymenobacter sp. BT190 TaxID=2763505 RepID=UPI0016513B30|nr:histidine kinase [Hymenobacter sp. BT190]MBC6700114.1 histidine kinase [Hymenobacter sp. BT190]